MSPPCLARCDALWKLSVTAGSPSLGGYDAQSEPYTGPIMRLHLRFKLLKSGALREAIRQTRILRKREDSPWRHAATPGHMRGIDFYKPLTLIWVMANAMRRYRLQHGCYPNLLKPSGFNEKVFWFKFFGELKTLESGDKLATHTFIPAGLQHLVQCAPLVWHSATASLPANEAIPAGVHYLKASHGSDMFKRVVYPLSAEVRQHLEVQAAKWLRTPYGIEDGEWWYSTFPPQLMLERSVTEAVEPTSWNFYVLNGQIPMIGMFVKHADGMSSSSWLDDQFEPLPWQSALPPVQGQCKPRNHAHLFSLAQHIARPFSSVRVDFLQGDDGQAYLCELTFAPGNALTKRAAEVDALLSAPWTTLK